MGPQTVPVPGAQQEIFIAALYGKSCAFRLEVKRCFQAILAKANAEHVLWVFGSRQVEINSKTRSSGVAISFSRI